MASERTVGENEGESPGLVRALGSFDVVLITVGNMVGSAIFLAAGDVARAVPHPAWLLALWAAGGLLTLAGALTYGELGAMYPRAGGLYHYLREAYGPLWGFLFGWASFAVIMSGGIATLGVGFGTYLASFLPFLSPQVSACLAILVLTGINHLGLKEGAGVQNALTVLKIGSIVAFVALGLFAPAPSHPALASPAGPAGGALLAAFGV